MVRRSTLIIVVVFALLLAGTLFWQRSKQGASTDATPTVGEEYLLDLDANVTGMRISNADGKVVELARDDQSQWQLTWPKGEQTDVAAAESAFGQLMSLRIVTTLGQVPDAEATGLATPAYKILLVLDNGQQVMINVGKQTPTGSGYYVLSSDRKLHVVDQFGLDSVLQLVDSPPVLATPTPEPVLEIPTGEAMPDATGTP